MATPLGGSIANCNKEEFKMPQYSRLLVLTTMIESGMVPVFYHPDPDASVKVIQACLDGGVRCFEFTNRGNLAHEVFGEIIKRLKSDKRLILGAGSIIEAGKRQSRVCQRH